MKPALLTPVVATPTTPGYVRQRVYNIRDYGAVVDCRTVTDGAITAAATALTSATAAFSASDVGKTIAVVGAGAAGAVLWATIASRQSTTQVTLSVAATTTVSAASVSLGTDDTTAWLSAITAAAVRGGRVTEDWGGTSLVSAPLPLPRGVSFSGVYPGVAPADVASWDLGFTIATGTIITFPGGTVFQQTMAGNGTASAVDGISVESLGFNQVGSIVVCGASSKSGICGSVLRDLLASNVSGIAFDLTNPMHVNGRNLKASYVSQLLRVTSDYDTALVNHQPGNCRFDDLYAYVSSAGQGSPSVHLRALNTNGRGTPLNFVHATRIQVNRFASVSQTGQHVLLAGASSAVTVNGCTLDGLDLEGNALHRLELSFAYKTRAHFVSDAAAGAAPADVYVRNGNNNHIECDDDNVQLDMDSSAHPLTWTGVMKGLVSGGGGVYPIGVWYAKTAAGDLQLGASHLTPISTATTLWTMPETYMDYNGHGGGARLRRSTWNSASVLTLNVSLMGYIEMTFAGATAVTLPDATTCPRQEVTFKQLGTAVTCTISTQLSQTIDGAATNVWLDTLNKYLTLYSNGTNWLIIAKG